MPSLYSGPVKADKVYTCAQLRTISFDKLVDRDPQELSKLLAAGVEDGFFYLDLTNPESQGLYEDYQDALAFMKAWFDQPVDEKMKYAYGSDTQGYKPIGSQTGATENSKDGFETLRIAQQGLNRTDKPLPPSVQQRHDLFNDFITKTRFHLTELLACFSDALGLLGANRYEHFHRDHRASNSSMTFHRYPKHASRDAANVGHNKHTDVGSLTFLYAQQWGLQVPSTVTPGGWDYVRPVPGHAIVNIGDSLRFLSGFRLKSALHRVVPVAEMELQHRFSVAYFIRPVHGTVFRDSEGGVIRAEDWFDRKFEVMRKSHREQRMDTVLTGGIEDVKLRARVHVAEELDL